MSGELVLVTGGSGFIAAHCILRLLEAGYRVRATLRSMSREPEARAMLTTGGAESSAVSYVPADLTSDAGWKEAATGCSFMLHVASPFPPGSPKNEDELIIPAREGAIRALKAARDAGVKRVVLTSSFAAIGYGHGPQDKVYTEEDWTDPDGPGVGAYPKSKTLAERAAWDFIAAQGGSLELSVINPVGVLGPVLGPDYSTSIQLVQRLMDGSVPGIPRVYFGIVDVRDVAELHLRAMVDPAAAGQRFLASAGDAVGMPEIAKAVKARLGEAASRVPTTVLPDFLVRLAGLFDPSIRLIASDLGRVKRISNEKARRRLGWKPRSIEEAVVATAESLVKLGLLRK